MCLHILWCLLVQSLLCSLSLSCCSSNCSQTYKTLRILFSLFQYFVLLSVSWIFSFVLDKLFFLTLILFSLFMVKLWIWCVYSTPLCVKTKGNKQYWRQICWSWRQLTLICYVARWLLRCSQKNDFFKKVILFSQ